MQLIKNITTYSNAESLLDKFLAEKVKRYGQMRNFDFGNIEKNFVSGLSPAINKRIISEHQIASKLLQNFKYTDVEKFIEQICGFQMVPCPKLNCKKTFCFNKIDQHLKSFHLF